jgi:hypothetical protein
MIDGRTRRALPIHHLLLVLLAVVLLYLGADFGRQVVASYQRQEDLRRIEGNVESARQETQRLEARLDYARSSQAAEAWAREQGWAKADEVPLVVIAPPASASPATDESAVEDGGSLSNREAWWAFFFGER